ncbi:helix-turn-helix domain-containing protein (plasmid) [Salinirubellus salinus]|uniref:Helix-turn-helix domain-containing protein n=1 Tax=Salinirubellus salinus TaxID=1364945 RepID=A0A9E7R6Q7_9EURY|nr:helix-turn-helix domain-containing protein [Salinirubellus salinus]UWM56946.1 helix-turn-helix domain-containing protein [Salinirubellus salinus]
MTRNRVVVFDEDPGESFRLEFDANAVQRVVGAYLEENPDFDEPLGGSDDPVQSVGDLRGYRKYSPDEDVEALLRVVRTGQLFDDPVLADRPRGHGAARAVVLSLLESRRDDLNNGVERVALPGNAVAAYDDIDGVLYIRRPPNLSAAAGVVGLDGTPIHRIWEGRLGCPPEAELQYERVLCDRCRRQYLMEVLGYRVYNTTPNIKPYSRQRHISKGKDLALIEAVYLETGVEPAVITTKTAERYLGREWTHVQASSHYGAVRGSNAFAGDEIQVGIVLGSQHPGDREILRLAALSGDRLELSERHLNRGPDLSYGVAARPEEPENPYLTYFREHVVVQSVLRFGRSAGATVYVHTGAVPDWILTDGPIGAEKSVIRERCAGEREVISALSDGAELTASEIGTRVTIAERTVYDRLGPLSEWCIIERVTERQPHRWRLLDPDRPGAGYVIDDQWYVRLPGTDGFVD